MGALPFFLWRLAAPLFRNLHPREGRAERRWRLDACDGTHIGPSLRVQTHVNVLVHARDARERACDRRADASIDSQARAEPALRSLRTPGCPWLRSICAHIEPRSPICGEASWVTRRREPSPFGAPRGISGPGPCLPLSVLLRPRGLRRIRTARLRPHSRPLGAASACPPGSCAFHRTGHRYPEERVSRTSPAQSLTASGTPQPRSAFQERLRRHPSGTRICDMWHVHIMGSRSNSRSMQTFFQRTLASSDIEETSIYK
jgi:hypothetical protein